MKNISFRFWSLYKFLYTFLLIYSFLGIFFFLYGEIFAESIPSIKVGFQNPTYLLEKELEKTEYQCDQTKSDCKVNIDLRWTFWGSIPSTYTCDIDFGFIKEKDNCNPNTVTFPNGEYNVVFRIYEKAHPENFQEKTIVIKNLKPVISIPDVFFTIQSGLETTLIWSYQCKTASCSINLTVEDIFTGSYLANNYECLWDFWSGILDNTGSTQNCNPSYVAYPFPWTHSVTLTLFEKWNPLNFKTGSLVFSNMLIPPVQTEGSWATQTSTWGTFTGTTSPETSSWSTETSTGTLSWSWEVIQNGSWSVSWSGAASETGSTNGWTSSQTSTGANIPDIIVSLQSPSYLTESGTWTFLCDQTKPECKVNFDTRETFGWYISTKFACNIDPNLFSWETDFCNPSTIIIPEWEYSIVFKIYEKANPWNFKEKKITVTNIKPKIEVPNPLIDIQSGLKITASGSYECSSAECSINVTAENSFSWVLSSNFSCLWDFWSGIADNVQSISTCNPSYVKFPSGNHTISLTIFETGNTENTKSITLSFANTFFDIVSDTIPPLKITFQSPSYVNFQSWDGETLTCDPREAECKVNFSLEETFWNFVPSGFTCQSDFWFQTGEESKCNPNTVIFPQWKSEIHFKIIEKHNPLHFQEKVIFVQNNQISPNGGYVWWEGGSEDTSTHFREVILQTWWTKSGNDVICESPNCKINLKYDKKWNELCLWDYGDISQKEEQKTTCNPTNFEVWPWDHPISLTIIDSKSNKVLETIQLFLHNSFPILWNSPPSAKITLQWKTSPKRILKDNTFICYTKTFCNVNVSAEKTYDPDKDTLDYTWWFGQGEVSSKKNPPAIQYHVGKYQIHLAVNDGKQTVHEYLYIDVRDQKEFPEDIKVIQEGIIPSNIRIKSVKPNPIGKDEKEYIELQNLSILSLNVKWFTLKSSKKSFTFSEDLFLKPFESKKIYKSLTNLTLWNTSDEVSLFFQDTQVDILSWAFKIPDGYILTHENLSIESQKVKVIEVIDGDTLIIQMENGQKEKLRLIGVDTPETVHPNIPVQAFWKEASDFMKKLLNGKEVTLELDSENTRDIYGRLLGYVYLDDEMVNKTLIREWYGRAYLHYPFKYSSEFEQLQTEAKKLKKWLWSDKEVAKLLLQEIKDETPKQQEIPLDSYDYLGKMWLWDISIVPYFQEVQTYILNLWNGKQVEKTVLQKLSWNKTPKQKFKKIKTIFNKVAFRLSVSKLKSGLKISWMTLSGSRVQISWYALPLEIQTGSDGKFLYKIEHGLIPWEYRLYFVVKSWEKIYEIPKSKTVSLSSEYVKQVEQKWQKKLESLKKKKKKWKKKKPKKPKKIPTVKITQNTFWVEKTHSESVPFFLLYYLLGIFAIFWGFLIYKRNSNIDKKI